MLIVPALVDEFRSLGPTLEDAVDDVYRWLVEDSPFDLTEKDVDDAASGSPTGSGRPCGPRTGRS